VVHLNNLQQDTTDPAALLAWHIAMGADEAIDDTPVDRFVAVAAVPEPQPTTRTPKPARATGGPTPIAARPAQPTSGAGATEAEAAARTCKSIEELKAALEAFDGGLLKRSAKNTVFSDGVIGVPLMVVGDVPSREDDQEGRAFAGPAGELLDKMLAAIGLNRSESAYLACLLPWRPLGNSKPDEHMLSVCKPFLEKHIELAKPKFVLRMGGAAGKALFGTADSISRQRGKWQDLNFGDQTVATVATYHPAYLLNQPHLKGAAWKDLLALREKLSS
jgi:uracil-DNA glycosylase family 4